MEFSQELVRGSIVPIILSLLKERAMYGYEMVKFVNARSNKALEWKEGTLYPALHRLEKSGWIAGKWETSPTKRRARYYRLTPAGRKQLVTLFEAMGPTDPRTIEARRKLSGLLFS